MEALLEGALMIEQADLEKLDELLEKVREYPDPRRASAEWKQIYALLGKSDLPARSYQHVVGMRDVAGLDSLLGDLHRAPDTTGGEDVPDAAECKKALSAFRKRAKLTRLDDESKLGRGPLSKGADKSLSAITPPADWPEEVWQHLVREGRLRYVGHGMYELVEQ
jgi:hypothetical protein